MATSNTAQWDLSLHHLSLLKAYMSQEEKKEEKPAPQEAKPQPKEEKPQPPPKEDKPAPPKQESKPPPKSAPSKVQRADVQLHSQQHLQHSYGPGSAPSFA